MSYRIERSGSIKTVSTETKNVVTLAKAIYESSLKSRLESEHFNRFVAIEPSSGDYFLADTFDDAVRAARTKYPTRLSHTIRIGHRAAFNIGVMQG